MKKLLMIINARSGLKNSKNEIIDAMKSVMKDKIVIMIVQTVQKNVVKKLK